MKRFFVLGLLAIGLSAVVETRASAFGIPPGVGAPCNRRVGRVAGYWLQPTRGPLYDYSSYFAAVYPYIPGAAEYQWQPTTPGAFGTSTAVLPTVPPRPARNAADPVVREVRHR